MTRTEKAGGIFKQGFNCSQAVFTAFKPEDFIDDASALKLATVFGAGVACGGNGACGAVTGALMAISAKHGRGDVESIQARAKTYELGQQFMKIFEKEHGSIMCEKLLGINIGTPENMKKANDEGLIKNICYPLVLSAGNILEKMGI
jgi:C_GCAxxG_C_C family probable redox protein